MFFENDAPSRERIMGEKNYPVFCLTQWKTTTAILAITTQTMSLQLAYKEFRAFDLGL